MTIIITDTPTNAQVETIRTGLVAYNRAQLPDLQQQPDGEFAVVARDTNNAIIGGAIGNYDWGYLFVDTLWVSDVARGTGIGTHILHTAEHHAIQQGITRSYLFTAHFQAVDFYRKLGYVEFGRLDDLPVGGYTIYFHKASLEVRNSPANVTIETPISHTTQAMLTVGLLHHADEAGYPIATDNNKLAALLYDNDATLRGGMYGGILWNWFDLRIAWVDEAWRGQGYGSRLLQRLIEQTRQIGLRGIICDTADFQALEFYQAHGFEFIGMLDDRPTKHHSYFLTLRHG